MSKIKDKKIEVREIVYSQDDEKSFGDVFIYEPENIEEQNLGNLFIVGELKDLPRNCSYIMNVLASKIKKEFYANTKRTAEEGLEAGLGEANKTLADLAEQGNGEYVGKLSMVCGTYHGNKFYLSQIGKIKSLLIREGQIMEIVKDDGGKPVSAKRAFNNIASGELSDGDLVIFAASGLFNILPLEKLRQLGSSMKLDEFAAKVQEEIEEEDSETVSALLIEIEGEKKNLIEHSEIELEKKEPVEKSLQKALVEGVEIEDLENENLINAEVGKLAESAAVSESEEEAGIQEAVLTSPEEKAPDANEILTPEVYEEIKTPEEQAREIAQNEPQKNARVKKSMAKNEIVPAIETPAEIVVASQGTAEAATGVAGATLTKEAGKVSLSDIIKEYEKMESKNIEQSTEKDKSIEEMIAKKEVNNFEDLDEKEENLPQKISGGVKKYLRSVKDSGAKAAIGGRFKKTFGSGKEYKVDRTNKKLSFLNKKMAVGVLLLVLVGGGYYYSSVKDKNEKAAKAAEYQSLLADSQKKMDQAEVESISGSEGSAGTLYIEARTLALRVKNDYDALDTEADKVIAKAQTEIDKIDKVERVSSPAVLASFENENIKNLVEASGTYYAVDGSENAIYSIDTGKAAIVQVAKAQEKIDNLSLAKNFQSQEILISNGTDFLSFNMKNNQIQKLGKKADVPFQDFATYGRYVYLLSPAQNQIYKYQKTAQGLDNKTEWLKGADIKNAISLVIDEYVYILTSDGQVKKFYTGEEYTDKDGNKFAIKQPSDAIMNPSKIYTSTEQKYLYVSEPSKNRIVIFDKTSGALVKQIVSEEFSNAKDFFVTAEENGMVVLVKNKIVKIDLAK